MRMKQKLLYVYEERIPEDLRKLVLSYFPAEEFEVKHMTYLAPDDEKKNLLKWADTVMFAPGRSLPDGILEAGKNIKLMQLWSSGYDKFNVAGAKKFGIPVANNGGANAGSVAEHTVLLMLAVGKWLPNSHMRTTTGTWRGNKHGFDMFMLKGKKVGIIGFGNIGRSVARILKGFQSNVSYYDIVRAPENIEKELNVSFVPYMGQLLEQSNIITLHLHANDSTKNIISAKEFGMMKKDTTLINVSRASLVDQDAFLEALTDGTLHGAGLDVYPKEPTEANNPILTLPNVVATPHMAGSTMDAYREALSNSVENFRRVAKGEKPKWVVND